MNFADIGLVDKLITTEGFGLRSWDDRYSKGVWVCLAPNSYDLEEVESASDSGDLDMIPSTDYLLSVGWLPFVIGRSFHDGLIRLEARLQDLPDNEMSRKSKWACAVSAALDHLRDVRSTSAFYGGMEGNFRRLSKSYQKLWE
jgi:hypothetical protein